MKRLGSAALAATLVMTACSTLGGDSLDTELSSLVLPLPDTGQTGSYTTVAGEDSDRIVNPPSYTDNGDGTVTDRVTGLVWQKADGGEMSFESALAYCDALVLGGLDDWRLPTAHELYSISYLGALGPALDTSIFSEDYAGIYGSEYLKELYWWSSEARADTATRAWVTNAGGGIGAHQKAETYSVTPTPSDGHVRYFHVRAVRSLASPTMPATRFAKSADGLTLLDGFTGLVWQVSVSPATYTWEEALAAASSLNAAGGYAGKTDWRLPNIRELYSLVDVAKMAPCIDGSAFDLSPIAPYAEPDSPDEPGAIWSSTSMYNSEPSRSSQAWDLHDLYSDIVSYSLKTATEHVLFVRGGDD